MILFLLVCTIILSPILSQTCPNNNLYGPNCNQTCQNCRLGCDISGSCVDATCITGYYGNGCSKELPIPNNPSFSTVTKNPSSTDPCTGTISTSLASNLPTIYPRQYHYNYNVSTTGNSFTGVMNLVNGKQEAIIQLNQNALYSFTVFFTFEDMEYAEDFNSSQSPIYQTNVFISNCSTSGSAVIVPPTMSSTSTISSSSASRSPNTLDFYVNNLDLKPSITYIVAQWEQQNNRNGFINYVVSISPGGQSGFTTSLSYNFTNLIPSTVYTVTVTSIYSTGSYPKSLTITTLSTLVPTNVIWNKMTGIISWNAPVNNTYTGFKIYINSSQIATLGANSTQYTIPNLISGIQYIVEIAATYGPSSEMGTTTILWTKPAQFSTPLSPPIITNINYTSFQVTFPTYTNYSGTINIYMIAVNTASSSSRQKRDTFSCSMAIAGVPNDAPIRYANNVSPGNQIITIGSGNTYPSLNCQNSPLNPGTNYTVFAIIGSLIDTTGEYVISSTTIVTTTPSGVSGGAIAGIVIAILLLLLLIILLILFLKCRKRRSDFFGIKGPYEDTKPMTHFYWSNIHDKMQPRKIILSSKNVSEGVTHKDEFDNLPLTHCDNHIGVTLNILDHTHQHSGDKIIGHHTHKSNYVASFIDGYIKKKAFISLQTPYDDESIADFWLMVYSDNVGQIVMLSMERELLNKNIYWPTKTDIYDLIEVTLISEDRYAYYDVRKFKIRRVDNYKENITVTQYHYRSWPYDDKLINMASFLEFHQLVKQSEDIVFGPIIVHSQLDCPLNAVFIGFDMLHDQLHQENEVNVYRVFAQLRRYRPNMMITISQYMLIYDFLFESYISGRYVADFNLRNSMDPSSRLWRFLEDQFKLLIEFKDVTYRNRIIKERYCVFDSVEFPRSIILATLPSHSADEISSFWDAAFENEIAIIIDLQNKVAEEMSYIHQSIYNFQISVKNTLSGHGDVMITKLSVTKLDTNDMKYIIVYSINSRSGLNYSIKDCDRWVELISNIMNDCSYNLLVFKTNDSFLSTVFLTCFNAASHLNYFHFVSVYLTIKSLQSSGHVILETMEEFKFIFEFLRTWIDSKIYNGNYDNTLKFDDIDPESPFRRGPYGNFNTTLNNY